MFNEKLSLELQEIQTGRVLTIEVGVLTLSMKTSLDEWLRYRFLSRAFHEGEDPADAEAMAEGLDIFANNWFLPSYGSMPRIVWELSKPGMSYSTFQKTFYELDLCEMQKKGRPFERFQNNMEVFNKAMAFAMQNPTPTEEGETPAQTTPPNPNENGSPAPSGNEAAPN